MDIPVLAWILFAVIVVAAGVVAFAFVRFVFHAREPEKTFTSVVAVTALMFALFTVVLVPVDVYNVSSTSDEHGNARLSPADVSSRMTSVRDLYLVLYGVMLFFLFIAIPFAYFYYEEDHPDITVNARVASACKYSISVLVIVVILVVIGIVLSGAKPDVKDDQAEAYLNHLLDSETKTEASISFAIASLTVIGFMCVVTFTGCGFGAMPVAMIAGSIHLESESRDVTESLLTTKEKARAIQAKYISGRRISKKDQKALDMLRRSEKQLTRRSARIQATRNTCWAKMTRFLRPLQILFGIVFLLLTLFLTISLIIGGVDRLKHSVCGYNCGWVLSRPQISNPFDMLMVKLATVFPLDYVILLGVYLFTFLATAAGLVRVSIRCFCFLMYRVRKAATVPQGVLLSVVIISLAFMAVNVMFVQLAPQYALFGSQVYALPDGSTKPCSIEAPIEAGCVMSQVGRFVTRISIKFPVLGTVFFVGNAGVIVMTLVSMLIAALRGRETATDWNGSSDSDDDYW
ncbi:uncharacterized protein AMSG_09373 [Thecamonas trahens ATCC 50062]|uniref:Lysosomal cobalamin transporter n=1 Tax=Thecamonas trahens ATCC 50062 TaxID=461836 RepID=A0A0L0DL76_THETB|nr:hypothetical protein AMSG_09373 [Thecamonas trahens ATCC 50062]KNC53074.1 hypothetical protein AMSG_09373 [Thecamonas trahens ATCC 50062]|eukprot:XP_013754749.1 hypothetical protein AMSG_09373 [Thecamonas trahens ATCC 50062]